VTVIAYHRGLLFFHHNQLLNFSFFVHDDDAFMKNMSMEILNTSKSEEVKDAKLQFSHGLKMTPSLA